MKKRIAGLVIAGLLVTGNVFAGDISLIGKKITSETDVFLDGELVGSAVVVSGTSYAPLRAVSEALGVDVKYEKGIGGSVVKLTNEDEVMVTYTKEYVLAKAALEAKIIGATNEIDRATKVIEYSDEQLKVEENADRITLHNKMKMEYQEKVITAQENIITYTNELLSLEEGAQ